MLWRKKKRRSLEDLKEEIESHLAHEADRLRDFGASPDPETAARRAFGNVASVQEAHYEHHHWMFFDHLKRDLRQAVRQAISRPAFSAVVILTLALGIGANSAIFGVIQAVLLRPLPYRDPSRLAMLFSGDPERELHEGRVSLANFADWKARNGSFDGMTVFIGQTFLLGDAEGSSSPERMRSARVTANFWTVLGVTPILGRAFTTEEENRGERVVVLSYDLWRQRFGGSHDALGANLLMDGRTYRIIGVMGPEFRFPFSDTRVWEPVTAHPYWTTRDRKDARGASVWLALGRLKPAVSWARAEEEMDAIGGRLHAEYPKSGPPHIAVVPLDAHSTGRFRASLWILFGAVFLMLLIACINVASLLLARSSVRRREFALRRALGAGWIRIASQLLTETLALASIGGLLGLALAYSALPLLIAFGPAGIPRLQEARMDWQLVLFTVAITVFTAVFASLWPAFESETKGAASRQWTTVSTRRVRDLLVAGEFALALVLVAGAGLLVHSFVRLRAVELGFQPDHLLTMRIDLHTGRGADQQVAYFEDAIRRVQSLPGVKSAAAITGFLRTDPEDSVEVEGRAPQHPGPCEDLIAGPYFETAGIPLKKGRVFQNEDSRNSTPVAIVNETMARAYWPGEDPIGKRFRFRPTTPWLTVIGVTGDMRRQGIERQIAPQVFRPHAQGSENMMDLIVRTYSEPATLAAAIQSEIQSIDRSVAKFAIATVDERLGDQTAERRFDTSLIGVFAFAALFLSAIGIYGLMHHTVAQRFTEIGVRMALGASPKLVVTMVLKQGFTLASIGISVGLLGTLMLSRLLSNLLYGVTPTDPISFAGSALLLLAVAGLACWIPARRASRIDPVVALRQD